jgi:dynein heavy chain
MSLASFSLSHQVEDFSPVLPVVNDLRNEALKERHWEQIHEKIGFEIHGDETLTLGGLIDKNVTHFQEDITNISTVASQEAVLEGMMAKVEKTWSPTELQVVPYKDVKDLYILGDTSETVAALDDSLVTVNTVLSSRFVAGIRDYVEEWRKTLNVMQETLDEWMTCQRNWMYLEAIFGSPDIVRQLPVAAKLFKAVDISWKATMKATFEEPNALKATTVKGRKMMFEAHNNHLDKIQKSLEEYLETKRASFPRFYFLSDDELLQILAQAKDPQAVQPHLRKCFDNLVRLDFGTEPGSIDILAMNSGEGEKVGLGKNLKARGNVEDWMTLLEQRVKTELTLCLKEGLIDYDAERKGQPRVRSEWVDDHPGQVVSSVAQMTWARGTERALRSEDSIAALPGMLKWQIDELNMLVLRIRSNLTKLQRAAIVALTTTDVHARDILDEMVTSGVDHIDDFLWQQQLRYYWERSGADDDCIIRHADSIVNYGYEYMGPTSRLVITPMTDRCWLTLTASFGLKLGAAPAGPAGTGKTESSKDLAKALAICCVVFNCSDQIDYKMMGKLFRGLAQGGYWICLDEFNRIDIEVLSVVAQQMVVLREGRVAKKKGINFMGINIRLIDHHVIITMNPGYAGRTELPDNLAVCFRPVSMMVPNYALIAEIMLFAEGFGDAKTLSRKMCKLYILCSEQLSQQPHYDYGLRAVKSVLVMAGGLKRANPDLAEDLVLIRALRDSNQPKFLADDIPLFQAIILDLFPGVEIPPNDYGEFLVTMEEELTKAELIHVPGIMNKIIQMYDVFCIRFGATLVGPAMGGKSTIYKILANIMTSLRLKGSENEIYQPVVYEILNPKCIRMGELYGEFHPMTQEWTDGLASTIMRKFVDYEDPRGPDVRRWTVFDGPSE